MSKRALTTSVAPVIGKSTDISIAVDVGCTV